MVSIINALWNGLSLIPIGKIETSLAENPTIKDYVKEFDRLGYGEWVRQFRQSINYEKIAQIVMGSLLSEKRQKALLVLIKRRFEELNDILQ